jgi:hypothetical protein
MSAHRTDHMAKPIRCLPPTEQDELAPAAATELCDCYAVIKENDELRGRGTRTLQPDQVTHHCNDQARLIELDPVPASSRHDVTPHGRAFREYLMRGNLFRRLISARYHDDRNLTRRNERGH